MVFIDDGAARSKDDTYHFTSTFDTPEIEGGFCDVVDLMNEGSLSVTVVSSHGLSEAANVRRAVVADSFGKLVVEP